MALINHPALYSGGNVKLDSTPYLRLAMQERARKEARGFAIDQYYQKLPETINDKGVRNQEVPIIAGIKNEMMEYWMNNRDAIRRGDPHHQMGMQQLFRKAQAVTRESQNASKIDMAAASMALNKDNQGILNSDEFLQQHTLHGLPVTDPNYKPLDLPQVMANRPFNADNYLKDVKNTFKYGFKLGDVAPHPQDNTLEVVNMVPDLDDKTKEGIYAYSASKLNNDRSFEKMLKKDFSNPESLAKLNEVSKSVFGHEIQTDEDIAAAYTASLLPTTATRPNVRVNIENQREWQEGQMKKRFAQQEKMANLNDRLIRKRKVDGVEETEIGYPTDIIADDLSEEVKLDSGQGVETKQIIYVDLIPVGTLRSINPTDINKNIKPVQPKQAKQPDGKYRAYYEVETDANGHKQYVGKDGKVIGAEDARNNYVKEVVPTKVKKEIITNRPKAQQTTTKPKKDPLGLF
jgi:hypothetical protein